jgi:hypothetical protein
MAPAWPSRLYFAQNSKIFKRNFGIGALLAMYRPLFAPSQAPFAPQAFANIYTERPIETVNLADQSS